MVSISSSSSTGSNISSNSKAISRRSAVSMGTCFSTVGHVLRKGKGKQPSSTAPPLSCSTAKIISVDGDLSEYKVPITVSEVLQAQFPTTSPSSHFLCNSDCLYYNDSIPAMSSNDPLLANQIYFLLPASKLNTKLSAADMAALAVKASAALQNIASIGSCKSKRRSKNKNCTQISPLLSEARKDFDHYREISGLDKPFSKAGGGNSTASGGGFARSGSVRKLQRYTSKRAKMAVRSFRLRLSTIYEGTVVH